jgi:hypothetical protein
MRYISIDIETMGLDPLEHSTIQVACIIEDTEKKLSYAKLPKLDFLVGHSLYKGTPYAMAMHGELFKELADPKKSTREIIPHWEVEKKIAQWLWDNGFADDKFASLKEMREKGKHITINVAGKNFGTFDKLFLEQLPNWGNHFRFSQRILDPAILFWKPEEDERLPNLELCKKRAKFKSTIVAHTALEDAWDVIQCLRKHY